MLIFLLFEYNPLSPNALNLKISVMPKVLNAVYVIVSVLFILVDSILILRLPFNIILPFVGACVISKN